MTEAPRIAMASNVSDDLNKPLYHDGEIVSVRLLMGKWHIAMMIDSTAYCHSKAYYYAVMTMDGTMHKIRYGKWVRPATMLEIRKWKEVCGE